MKSATLFLTLAATAGVLSSSASAEAVKSAGYAVKNRSTFNASADVRIPFWPVGWARPTVASEKAGAETMVAAPKVKLEPSHFSVTSILLGNPALATINGRSFAEGEVLPVVYGTERLRIVVRAIRDGGVVLDYQGQQVVVPMNRPTFGARPAQDKAGPVEFTIKIGPAADKKL